MKNIGKIFIGLIVFIALLIFALVMLFNNLLNNSSNFGDLKIFTILFFILLIWWLPFFLIIYLTTYIIKSERDGYIRTPKGERVNEKLEGLKNYLKDFSLINEKDEKSLVLWEDYLIYSVIFNQNTKIVKDMYNKYIKF